jgi:hypothetical protein
VTHVFFYKSKIRLLIHLLIYNMCLALIIFKILLNNSLTRYFTVSSIMDNNKKIRDIRFSEMTVGDVKHILNTVAKYSMMCFIVIAV